ncbi:2-hydroxyacid dehydrogenase [Shimia thalassica]|uniref:2-hydroxyacid dehydrogenase n=1 Tax=Shimia thalassica TaxID=1715693 RepID=UPI0026E2C3FD|nr:glyoxylate/hydroxypyruvate reductase A [Shimia thalassica]MDO6481280.1 glyoxylate/hydroxypyruvate reductase A [Shimia thalassica]
MINVLFAAKTERWNTYETPLRTAFAEQDLEVDLRTEFPPEDVDYIVYAPNGDLHDFTPFTRCKAVLNLWAGVEDVVGNQTLSQPLARMVDYGLTQGMVEWVTGHTLRHHLGMDQHILGQDGEWRSFVPPLAEDRRVTILGLGTLGLACAKALIGLGFPVTGWSRTAKDIEGITCLHGPDGLREAVSTADVLILLLPNTAATENTVDSQALADMPEGAFIINPGRGPLIDDDALLKALDSGHIAHATLDVFRIEPLPADHPYWSHPKVTVTPHIASETRPSSASRVIAENIRRGQSGEPFLHLVDRGAGY